MEFDFVRHILWVNTTDGQERAMSLSPKSVASFYHELMLLLGSLDINVKIDLEPKEIPGATLPFDQDEQHSSYDPEYAARFWRILLGAERVLQKFRGGFIGKCSPVHFFWGSFDLAVTRFSGRPAPAKPDADHITQLGYSHELHSIGFWPGNGNIQEPAFYAYAAPEPPGFAGAKILPREAFYNQETKGFILPYEAVRTSANPDQLILDFCQSTYNAAASLGNWDPALERESFRLKRAA